MMSPSRSLFLSAAIAALVSASCGSSGPSAANVYLTSTLGASDLGSTASCNIGEVDAPFLTIGSAANPISTGSNYTDDAGSGNVEVTCSVSAMGATMYQVTAYIGFGNSGALGSVQLSGTLSDTTGAQGPFSGSFGSTTTGYSEQDCTVTLTTTQDPPITSGRVWGTLSCPNITGGGYTCAATATFVLQNCDD
jgi:hypothetical protein